MPVNAPTGLTGLRSFSLALNRLNELSSCFNPWIITPSFLGNEDEALIALGTLTTTVAYAVLEPFFTKEILRFSAPPWIPVLVLSPFHLLWSLNIADIYNWLYEAPIKSRRTVPPETKESRGRFRKISPEKIYLPLILLLPVTSSAAINASLVLLSQSLYATTPLDQPGVFFRNIAAILVFLICRYSDYVMYKKTYRGGALRKRVMWQITLCTLRAFMRTIHDIAPFIAFQVPDASEIERNFGAERYIWMEERTPRVSTPVVLALSLASAPFTLLGHFFKHRGIKERL